LRGGTAPSLFGHALIQHIGHGAKYFFKRALRAYIAARDIARKRDHRARVADILKMLARQIRAYDLRTYID